MVELSGSIPCIFGKFKKTMEKLYHGAMIGISHNPTWRNNYDNLDSFGDGLVLFYFLRSAAMDCISADCLLYKKAVPLLL